MQKINGYPKNLVTLLGSRYFIPYYQREYKWEKKQMLELVEDLSDEFLNNYQVDHGLKDVDRYGMYFLGPVIVTDDKFVIDGQQRLTSLTLVLIYLNHLQREWESKPIALDNLIYTESYGEKAFVINDDERNKCMTGLFEDGRYKISEGESESVRTILERYGDILGFFDDKLNNESLPFFIEWLKNKVVFIEIVADTVDDAHRIFESMNDRGLRLSSVEMLKGYLLARIKDESSRNKSNDIWKKWMRKLNDTGDNTDNVFINTWLRAKYAQTIRERKAGSENQDYEHIATMANKWVAQNDRQLGLYKSSDYERVIISEIPFYASVFLKINKLSKTFHPEYEYVFYNAHRDFTLQTQLMIAAVMPSDTEDIVNRKIKLISFFIDQYISMRSFAFRSVSYSSTLYTMFNVTKDVRDKSLDELIPYVRASVKQLQDQFPFSNIDHFLLNQFSARYMLHILARLTYFITKESGTEIDFEQLVSRKVKDSYDIEHIWSNHYEQDDHRFEFQTAREFEEFRNNFGGMVILPKSVNRSLQDLPYEEKRFKYNQQNLLARSLHEDCYRNEPGFLRFINRSSLDFKPYDKFGKQELFERQSLYRSIAEQIWSIDHMATCI